MVAKKPKKEHVVTGNQRKYIKYLETSLKSAQNLRAKYYRESERLQRIADKSGDPEDHILAMRVSGISSRYREIELRFGNMIQSVKQIGWVERT